MTDIEVYQERREAVAARITQNPEQFSMRGWRQFTTCGSKYCIGGMAAHIAEERGEVWWFTDPIILVECNGGVLRGRDILSWACEWLGIPGRASELFTADAPHQTPEDAALALKSAPYIEPYIERKTQ